MVKSKKLFLFIFSGLIEQFLHGKVAYTKDSLSRGEFDVYGPVTVDMGSSSVWEKISFYICEFIRNAILISGLKVP